MPSVKAYRNVDMKRIRCGEDTLTHGADQNDTLNLDTLVLQESSQQLYPGPTYMEVKLLKKKKITSMLKYVRQLFRQI